MSMTKRDIADIVLVWMAVSFVLALLKSILTLGAFLGMTDEAMQYTAKTTAVTFQVIHLLFLVFLNYFLLFKRSLVLSIVFPDGREKELSMPAGLAALASYSFWVRLFGISIFLTSSIAFLGRLVTDLASNRRLVGDPIWIMQSGSQLVSAILAVLVIWKADWIAEKLEKKESSNK